MDEKDQGVPAATGRAQGRPIGRDVAESEFERWTEAMGLEFDLGGMDAEDRTGFQKHRGRLVRAIENGHLRVDDEGQFVYSPQKEDPPGRPVVFREPRGSSWMAMDSKKRDKDISKLYAAIADATGENSKRFANMVNRDIQICQAIMLLFLD